MEKIVIELGEDQNRRVVVVGCPEEIEILVKRSLGEVAPRSDAQDYLLRVGLEVSRYFCGFSWEVQMTLGGEKHKLVYESEA